MDSESPLLGYYHLLREALTQKLAREKTGKSVWDHRMVLKTRCSLAGSLLGYKFSGQETKYAHEFETIERNAKVYSEDCPFYELLKGGVLAPVRNEMTQDLFFAFFCIDPTLKSTCFVEKGYLLVPMNIHGLEGINFCELGGVLVRVFFLRYYNPGDNPNPKANTIFIPKLQGSLKSVLPFFQQMIYVDSEYKHEWKGDTLPPKWTEPRLLDPVISGLRRAYFLVAEKEDSKCSYRGIITRKDAAKNTKDVIKALVVYEPTSVGPNDFGLKLQDFLVHELYLNSDSEKIYLPYAFPAELDERKFDYEATIGDEPFDYVDDALEDEEEIPTPLPLVDPHTPDAKPKSHSQNAPFKKRKLPFSDISPSQKKHSNETNDDQDLCSPLDEEDPEATQKEN